MKVWVSSLTSGLGPDFDVTIGVSTSREKGKSLCYHEEYDEIVWDDYPLVSVGRDDDDLYTVEEFTLSEG